MSVIALPKAAENLRELGRLQDIPLVRQLGLLALVAVTIALGLWLFSWTQKPDYVPVHAGLDAKSTVLLFLSLIVASQTLANGRTTVLQGAIHLMLFAVYLFTTFVP